MKVGLLQGSTTVLVLIPPILFTRRVRGVRGQVLEDIVILMMWKFSCTIWQILIIKFSDQQVVVDNPTPGNQT